MLSQSVGNFHSWEKTTYGLNIQAENALIEIEVWTSSVVRIRIRKPNQLRSEVHYGLEGAPMKVMYEISEDPSVLTIQFRDFQLVCQKEPLRFSFQTPEGKIINEDDPSFGTTWIGNEVSTYKSLQEKERFIGLGEKTGDLDRRGDAYVNWNTDYFAYPADGDPLYLSTPFYIGIHSGLCYGIYLNNTHKTTFNFGASTDRFSYFSAEYGEMDYFFFYGESIATIIESYAALTGKMPLPPKWSLGLQQCRYSYYPESEVRNVAQNYRDRKIPADVIYLDIHYMDEYKVFTFDEKRFPDPQQLTKDLSDQGFKLALILDPGVKQEPGYPPYDEGMRDDHFVKYPDGKPFNAEVWPGWSHFPDFTRDKTRKWWAGWVKMYADAGVEGFWNDMNEPACWGQHVPDLIEFEYEGEKTTHKKARNVYGMNMARATYEGAKRAMNGQRPFMLTRAGFSGVQRYAAVWTGDNVASDEHMLAGVRLLNSMGLTGIPYAGYDVGGFAGEASPALFARWISIAAFSPFFRCHSMINTRDAEPWAFGEEVEDISRNYVNLRYRLMPYIYSLFAEAASSGMPVVRSLALEWPHEERVYDPAYQNQYLFGPNLLICPIESTKETGKVFLPEGTWYDLYNGKRYEGDQVHFVDCPMERLPVFVRGGGLLIMQSLVQSLSETPEPVIEIHVYKGDKSSFEWYEDDGTSYAFEKGAFSKRMIRTGGGTLLGMSEVKGTYEHPFNAAKVFFHDYEQLPPTLSVNGNSMKVQHSDVAYTDPISSFDPFIPPAVPEVNASIPWVEFPLSDGAVTIKA